LPKSRRLDARTPRHYLRRHGGSLSICSGACRSWSWSEPLRSADLVEITGVGFFYFEHGQNGVALTAIELHPVVAIRRIPEFTASSSR
jgi:hypothetical protein